MADKSISELVSATQVQPTDLFVLQQDNTAKKLTGQVLENWLVSFADGHGGIQSIEKQGTSGLKDTYRITLADTTTFDFVVTNGKGITGISKTSTSGLKDTYTIRYNDSTTSTFTVTNGAKGDKGDNAYVWIKYASQQPTSSSSSMGDEPDDWMGVYSGTKSTAPTDPMEYKWSLTKGEKGATGNPATIVTNKTEYQVSNSGTIIPSGIWSTSIPVVTPGKYLWARTTTQFNSGSANYAYSISRFGIDGTGSVVTVNDVSPDEFGNVELTAEQLECLGLSGGTMTGPIHMSGQVIDGLNDPTSDTEAARKAYVDKSVKNASVCNILDNSDFTHFIAQAGLGGKHGNSVYAGDRWVMTDGSINGNTSPDGFGFTNISISANKGNYCNLYQKLGNFSAIQGDPYTVALYDGSGIYVENFKMGQQSGPIMLGVINFFSTSGTNVLLSIPQGQTVSIKWVMVIPGTYTADTLPNYPSKGYAAELAQCQMYYKEISLRGVTGFVDNVTTNATFKISESEMRINPTAKIIEAGNAILHTDSLGSVVLQIASVVSVSDNGKIITISFASQSYAIAAYSAISVYSYSVALSADL